MKVMVLLGGWSAEREISLLSGKPVIEALQGKYDVVAYDPPQDIARIVTDIQRIKPDVVFNTLHGPGGEDGVIQGILDLLKIPYTHSGRTASCIGMNKVFTKAIASQLGITVPFGEVVDVRKFATSIPYPYIIKPICDGSSNGITVVKNAEQIPDFSDWSYGEKVLVEEFSKGTSVSVAILNDRAIGTLELRSLIDVDFADFDVKYTKGCSEHIFPAPLEKEVQDTICQQSLLLHQALGCRGLSRADWHLCDDQRIYFLEINTHPGLTPVSQVPDIARHVGISFEKLLENLIDGAKWG